MATKIEWADESWNPVTGCSPVSEGCRNCYAKRMATRLRGRAGYPQDEPFRVTLHPERLDQPLRWRKPRRIFVCSMGDLFHERVPDLIMYDVFSVARRAVQHTFMILTKRPERMARQVLLPPPANVWLGVSIEDQATADERIPRLLRTPAAHRFVSYEPALGAVDLNQAVRAGGMQFGCAGDPERRGAMHHGTGAPGCPRGLHHHHDERCSWGGMIHLVIAGGETGPHARPAHPDWFRSVRDQCVAARVPFMFKHWGEFSPAEDMTAFLSEIMTTQLAGHGRDGIVGQWFRVGRKRAGRLLDGREWNGGEEQNGQN